MKKDKENIITAIHDTLLVSMGPGYGIPLRNTEDLALMTKSQLRLILRMLYGMQGKRLKNGRMPEKLNESRS